jgi:hypothetical protein
MIYRNSYCIRPPHARADEERERGALLDGLLVLATVHSRAGVCVPIGAAGVGMERLAGDVEKLSLERGPPKDYGLRA